jgi:hypothetical protein
MHVVHLQGRRAARDVQIVPPERHRSFPSMDASNIAAAGPYAPYVDMAHRSHRTLDAVSNASHGLAAVVGETSGLHMLPGLVTGGILIGAPKPLSHTSIAVASHAGLATDATVTGIHLVRGTAEHGAAVAGGFRALLGRGAHLLGRVVPWWTIGVGALDAAHGVSLTGSPAGLAQTQDGRRGVLDIVGGALMLVPHPIARFTGAGAFATSILNDLGAFSGLDARGPSPMQVGPGMLPH